MSSEIDPRILEAVKNITAKRPHTVIQHIIKHGYVTTEELKELYGYNHAPRAARDVREAGIPLETFKLPSSTGRAIAGYRFGDPDKIEAHKLDGRQVFSKAFKNTLIDMYGSRCAITGEEYPPLYLQIDHRIPYEVAGDNVAQENEPENFMLLTGTTQRQKSWSCEHCENFKTLKRDSICKNCYWAWPESYTHIAMMPIRRIAIDFIGDSDMDIYQKINEHCVKHDIAIQDFIKKVLSEL
ncbi:MAG: hypothetical protein E7K06_10995 [Corynebacterium sp.]|nr:hypothetical protein [Corynebacterium sp.]MDU7865312.1 hypothetical protein [Serratia marcescens]DAL64220.1 MAG TPA_asm: ICEA Protein [Caudoviricetes sp.]